MGLRLFDNPLHLVLLLVVILIVFGAGKLPSVGSALGQSIKEFKKASTNDDEAKSTQATVGGTCEKCHAVIPDGAQFCASCGAPVRTLVANTAASVAEGGVACAQCGAKNATGARFCAQCGSGLEVRAG